MKMPPFVAVVCAHLKWLGDQLAAMDAHQKEVSVAERAARGGVIRDWELECGVEPLRRPLLQSISEHRARLVKLAEREFAPAGAVLEIPDDEPRAADWEQTFDAEAFWGQLAARYQTSGAAIAFERTAGKLKGRFRPLRDGSEVKIVGGCPVLELSNWGNVWGYHFKESLREVVGLLTAVAGWAQLLDSAAETGLNALQTRASGSTEKVDPHTKVVAPGLFTAVLFNSKVEFRLTPAFAEQLQIFVDQYDAAAARAVA